MSDDIQRSRPWVRDMEGEALGGGARSQAQELLSS